jgi:hypothetical protein
MRTLTPTPADPTPVERYWLDVVELGERAAVCFDFENHGPALRDLVITGRWLLAGHHTIPGKD